MNDIILLLRQPLIFLSIGGMVFLFGGLLSMFCLKAYRLKASMAKVNCLMWRHPDNTSTGMAKLEPVAIPVPTLPWVEEYKRKNKRPTHKDEAKQVALQTKYDSKMVAAYEAIYGRGTFYDKTKQTVLPGGIFHYRPGGGLTGWVVGWKDLKWCWEDKTNGTTVFKPFSPDDYVNEHSITTAKLADKIDWSPARRPLRLNRGKMLEKVGMVGLGLMGVASVIGIIFVGVLAQGK